MFFLFTIFTFAEIYKIYFNSLSISQKFTIKKIISTRYNLNDPAIALKYQRTLPSIDLINKQYNFESSEISFISEKYILNIPKKKRNRNYKNK